MKKLLTTHSDVDALVAYIHRGEGDLTEAMEEKLNRMKVCADLIRQHMSRLLVVPKLMALYRCARSEAYRIFDETTLVFAPPATASQRTLYVDIILGKMTLTHEKALEAGDFRAAATVLDKMVKVVEKFFGDKDALDWSVIQPPRFLFLFDPKLLGNFQYPQHQLDGFVEKLLQTKRKKSLADFSLVEDAQVVQEARKS